MWKSLVLLLVFVICDASRVYSIANSNDSHPCTLRTNDHLYDLRLLSTNSHAWSVNDSSSNTVYWINVCHKLPRSVNCMSPTSAICGCTNGVQCINDLGDINNFTLYISGNKDLTLTYWNGVSPKCANTSTSIIFKCGAARGNPQFVGHENCSYTFKWESYVACPVDDSDEILEEKNGYIYSQRHNISVKVSPFFEHEYNITGFNNHSSDTYYYLINLANATLPTSKNCETASVCQTKPGQIGNKVFERNIGSYKNHEFIMRKQSIELRIYSANHQKCGKNINKNVTSIFELKCTDEDLIEPSFVYESNHCDYIFRWGSKDICDRIPGRVDISGITHNESKEYNNEQHSAPVPSKEATTKTSSSSTSSSFGIILLCFALICFVSLFGFFILKRERVARVAQTVRNTIQSHASPSFNYSQMSTDTAKLVAAEYKTNETLESLAA